MSDGDKSGISRAIEDVNQAVVKPVVDEVGQALELGVKSVIGGPQTTQDDPAKRQQKQLEEQKKKQEALRVLDWYKKIEESQKVVRTQSQQQVQEKESQEAEEEKVQQFKVMEKQKKQQSIAITQAKTKTEARGGVGG
ncbi:MAG: hypothetical protein Q7S88_01385 [Candidatus Daviesbacteria bacterium]|nr:hypothetical protein [Candidatus Daviesbacteria bacterium]